MKERPLNCAPEIALAYHEGRKTQTRRIIRPQPVYCPDDPFHVYSCDCDKEKQSYTPITMIYKYGTDEILSSCPYGQPGDRLWVRESFKIERGDEGTNCIIYKADHDLPKIIWKPSINMPRWASRTILEITGVRVERLQEITETDAISEGISGGGTHPDFWVGAFKDLWNYIHGEDTWDKNPWVWVIETKKVTK